MHDSLENFYRNLLPGVFVFALSAAPAFAHKIQVAADVGGTLHIEPNDTPRAGEPSLAWFALTRKGGQVIPLDQCNCQLSVYTSTADPGSPPLLTPSLKAVSAERYQGIPGAEIRFPQPGVYQLQLSGTPKAEGDFQPFQLKFDATVTAGTTTPTATPQPSNRSLSQPATVLHTFAIVVAMLLGLGIFWSVWRRRK
jgi:hypothetical protein